MIKKVLEEGSPYYEELMQAAKLKHTATMNLIATIVGILVTAVSTLIVASMAARYGEWLAAFPIVHMGTVIWHGIDLAIRHAQNLHEVNVLIDDICEKIMEEE